MAEKGEVCMYTPKDREAIKKIEGTPEVRVQDNGVLGDQQVAPVQNPGQQMQAAAQEEQIIIQAPGQQMQAVEQEEQIIIQVQDQQMQAAVQENQIAPTRELFLKQTKKMKDTAKLGRKTLGFKADTEEEKQKNKKIELSKQLTKEATADTMYVYKVIEEINLEEKIDRLKTEDKRRDSIGNVLFRLEQYHFKPEMYYSSNIKANLKEYLWLVRDFNYVYHSVAGTELAGTYWARIVKLHPVFTCLEKRLQVYCEQNRIHLDGTVLGDDEFGTMLTSQDRLEWFNSVQAYNEAQEEEHRAEEQEEEHRAKMLRDLFEPQEEQVEEQQEEQEEEQQEEQQEEQEEEYWAKTLRDLFEPQEEQEDEETALNIQAEVQKQEQFRKADNIGENLAGELERAKENGEDTEEILDDLEEVREDQQRLREREAKEETGMSNVQSQESVQEMPALQMTRFMAVSNYSDRMSNRSRAELRDLNYQLMRAGRQAVRERDKAIAEKVAERVNKYALGNRYVVGYTKEREFLMDAMNAVEKALETLQKDLMSMGEGAETEGVRQVVHAMEGVQGYFKKMTNGTLPEGVVDPKYDYSEKAMEETGDVAGRRRTKLINAFSYWSDQKDTPLFAHEPTINDLKQRLVSNCYMLAGVTGLINQNPDLIKQCIRDNGNGTVTVRLYEWQKVEPTETGETDETADEKDEMVDKKEDSEEVIEIAKTELRPIYVKVTKEIPRIAGADALSAGALWMQMIEKACACVGRNGAKGYRSLWYGNGGDFLERLLGVSPKRVSIDNQDELFEKLRRAREDGYVYNAGTKKTAGRGLSTGHAYAVLGAEERDGVRYVWLRNPYSNMSAKYRSSGVRHSTASDISSDETYGQFYIKLDDFCRDFTNVTCTDTNKAFQV